MFSKLPLIIIFFSVVCASAQPTGDSLKPVKKKFVNTKKIAKKPLCVNSRGYTAEEILQLTPFAGSNQVKLVSYFKIKRDRSTDHILSLIDEKGNYEPAKWEEEITLNGEQVKKLGNILFNYGNQKIPYMIDEPQCYMPNNAILFYDSSGKLSSVIEVSFACQTMQSIPSNLETGTWCSEKFDVLRKFFEDSGMKFYGMDD